MADLKIFSYLPNPRVWKAQIAAVLGGVDLEVVGDKPRAMGDWLWDSSPRRLTPQDRDPTGPYARTSRRGFQGTLYKTDRFLRAHPFGTVPAAFGGPEACGIFESNSILRAVARLSPPELGLYGQGGMEASRIDSFLDASLVFAREAQVYLLAADRMDGALAGRMTEAYGFFLDGVENALTHDPFVAGEQLTIADISVVCDLSQFLRERLMADRLAATGFTPVSEGLEAAYPRVTQHLRQLTARPAFAPYLEHSLEQTLLPASAV